MLKLHILARGSRGNAAVVENAATGRGVLIDCGICKRDFFSRCDEAGFDPAKLDAVLITHEHGDHDFGIMADVDLDATQEAGEAVLANYRVGFAEDILD